MKLGEIYHNRFNHYDSEIINISIKEITLKAVNSGVVDHVKLEHFNLNWVKVYSIFDFKSTIKSYFAGRTLLTRNNAIAVMIDGGWIEFRIKGDSLIAKFADVTQQQLQLDDSELAFDSNETKSVIELLASLVTD